MAKSIVTDVELKKEGTGKFGQYFIHTITFADGVSGDYMAKSKDQSAFKIGTEAEYTYEEKVNGNYTNKTVKPVSTGNGFAGKPFTPKDQTPDNKRTALACAVNMVVANIVDAKQLKETMDKFMSYLT